ncbi:WG repeat-containing protein [Lacinutrix sp. Bg11-31]|uniref:WG repeat-containing protein n=1 Tax=Lacinutrix sp. Bg11-31 TaxID=2057808 RepID=UPI000C30BF89|nr:WG repeat-containing protein [Lacinutrix sp. Bg11-31]AUC81127.1 hypothetical protein CW733_02860 [Lacinutrix sp. Bg11-31]
MKKAAILVFTLIIIPFLGYTQNIDYISPFHNDVAAIKKGDQWAFINTEGDILVAFRNDLVLTNVNSKSYPIFKKERCLITYKKEGISYYGYIDKSGKTIIEPQFLNATNFDFDFAIALELMKEDIGKNKLNINVYYYKYFEVLIDTNGKITKYLDPDNATYIALDKSSLIKAPSITSKLLSNTIFATLGKTKKWTIQKI